MPDSVDEEREAQIRRRVQHFADTNTLPEDFQRYHYDDWMFLLRRLREDTGPDRAYEAELRQIISTLQDERDAARVSLRALQEETAHLREDVERLNYCSATVQNNLEVAVNLIRALGQRRPS